VSALSFDLQPTDLVGALTLQIDGSPPPQVSVAACQATETFTTSDNGPWAQAPAYADDACVQGKKKGDAVVFADAGTLVNDGRLAVVVLPGPLDRVVFKKPTDAALTVQHGTGVGGAAPPLGTGTATGPETGGGSGGPPPATGGGAPASSGASGGSTIAPPVSDSSSLPGESTASGSDAAPVVAPPDQSTSATPPATAAAASSGLSTGSRRAIALAVIALEVLGFLLLRRKSAAGVVPAATAGVAAGRLRAPDRMAPTAGGAERTGGVGRFRRDRHGPAPQL
jgi:hypothetical protein